MKEFLKNQIVKVWSFIKALAMACIIFVSVLAIIKLLFNLQMPNFSWWSATFLSDNYSKSIITEVEASGHNVRSISYIDSFGRVCTSIYANAGTGFDCDYPPEDKKNWTIEDYRKQLKK